MKTCIAFGLTILALVTSCSQISNSTAPLSTNEKALCCKTWTLSEEWVPNGDGSVNHHVFHPTDDVRFIYIFKADHSFIQDTVGGCCRRKGVWSLIDEDTKLELFSSSYSRVMVFEVRELSTQNLKLAWLGREGMVVELYMPQEG